MQKRDRKPHIFIKRPASPLLALIVIISAYFIYGLKLIFLSSYEIHNTKYFSLIDDQMISMRYAKNLADGHGLIWNPGGEHIEGITNLLWAGYMAVVHLLGFPIHQTSFLMQLSGLLLLSANLFVIYHIARFLKPNAVLFRLGAVALTASYFPLNTWGVLYGSEISVLTLGISTAVLLGLHSIRDQRLHPLLPVLLGILTLIRVDIIFFSIILLLCLTLLIKKRKKQTLLKGFGILFLFFGAQTLFRIWYYHDIFPNTYYLKVVGFPTHLRMLAGLFAHGNFVQTLGVLLYAIPFVVLLFKNNKYLLLLLSCVVAQQLYGIYVGGDMLETQGTGFRYQHPVIPLFFILVVYVVNEIVEKHKRLFRTSYAPELVLGVFVLLTGWSINTFNQDIANQWLLRKQPSMVGGNKINTERALTINRISTKEAQVAVIWAGTTAYYSDRTFVDLFGKSDRVVGKTPMQVYPPANTAWEKARAFVPGHMKWDYAYSLGKLRPDIVVAIDPAAHAAPYIQNNYHKEDFGEFFLYVRNDSPNLRR